VNYDYQSQFIGGRSAVQDRITFVRSVYLWLMAGFGVAGLAALGAVFTVPLWMAGFEKGGMLFGLLLVGSQWGSIIFASRVSRRRPLNILAYGLATALLGYVAGIVSIFYASANGAGTVMAAFGMTAADFLVLTTVAFVSKKDFSFLRNFVIVGISIMLIGSLISMFFHLPTFGLIIAAVAVIACSAKILWDTSNMLRTQDYSDPAGFALSLFVSLYNIFLSLLRLLGGRRN